MPKYTFEVLDDGDRGPEPLLRIREQVEDEGDLLAYKLTQEDVDRIHRFSLASLALKFFKDEDLDWIIRDVNDNILDDILIRVGDVVQIPKTWQRIAKSSRRSIPTARTRISRTVR